MPFKSVEAEAAVGEVFFHEFTEQPQMGACGWAFDALHPFGTGPCEQSVAGFGGEGSGAGGQGGAESTERTACPMGESHFFRGVQRAMTGGTGIQ